MCFLPQEPQLLPVTIAENIVYGMPEDAYTAESIVQAAKEANVHDFIASLPDRYLTHVRAWPWPDACMGLGCVRIHARIPIHPPQSTPTTGGGGRGLHQRRRKAAHLLGPRHHSTPTDFVAGRTDQRLGRGVGEG